MSENTNPTIVRLSGYSDDCHQLQFDEGPVEEEYEPFLVKIRNRQTGVLLTVRMFCNDDGKWVCEIELPQPVPGWAPSFDVTWEKG